MYHHVSLWTFIFLLGLAAGLPVVGLEGSKQPVHESPYASETVIESEAPEKNDLKIILNKDKSADQTSNDAAMLFHIPGLTITEDGGPLSGARIRYRGLANSRMPVFLEGLALNNPINGISDANAMFLFAAKNLQANAQSLSITLPKVDEPHGKGVVGYGSQNSLKLGGITGVPLGKNSSVLVAMQASSTNGQFSFSSPQLTKADPKNTFMRHNNDQHRLQALMKLEHTTVKSNSQALLAFNAHEGGLPGFAFSPNLNLRNRALFSGLSARTAHKIKKAELSINVANSLFDYRTYESKKHHDQKLRASTHEITLGFKSLTMPSWFDFDWGEQIIIEKAYDLDKSRIGVGFLMHRTTKWTGRLKPQMFSNFSMVGFEEHGFIFKKELGVTIQPHERMSITGRFMRSQRLPTFLELYAQNSFFVGNPELKKESILDVELGTTLKIAPQAVLKLNGFFGYLSDLIVDVPFMAVMLRPVNIDTARRYGLDMGLTLEPLDWLLLESTNSLQNTKIRSTEAPLPHAPWFSGLSRVRFGNEDSATVSLQTRYKGPSYANLFGTLKSEGFGLVDALLFVKPYERLGLSLSISNIFHHTTARDSYEMPLPGIGFFGQVELGSI